MEREFLRELGVSEEAVEKIMMENGKDIAAEGKKRNQKLIDERDAVQRRLDDAEATLKGFEGIDPAKINQELADWKKKAQDAEKDFKAQLTQRDQRDWLKGKLDEYGVKSPYARKQLEQECMVQGSGFAWKDGSWAEILAACADGSYKQKYKVYNYKSLDIGAEGIIKMQIVGIDVDELADGTRKAPLSWIGIELLKSSHRWNPAKKGTQEGIGTMGGWEHCELRTYLKETIKPLMSQIIKDNIRVVKKTHIFISANGEKI